MEQVQIVFPTAWDRRQLAAAEDLPRVGFAAPEDADCRWDFDVLGMIDGAMTEWRGDVAGVFSSSDYPGAAAAAAIGTGLGLPSCRPEALLRTAHKGMARRLQAEVAPEATPRFQVLDPDRFTAASFTLPLPCFVKPAKGTFSRLARRIDSITELRGFLDSQAAKEHRTHFLHIHRLLLRRYLGSEAAADAFVAEELLPGRLCTVEGFVTGERAHVLGVVDSLRDERTGSFTGFEYPSALPQRVQRRLSELATRLALHHGLRWTMFNVEFAWDAASDHIGIIEVNPRMCGQFADLYHKVDGVHGYRVAIDLALGREPVIARGQGAYACAASFPLRMFEPVRVVRAPGADELAAVEGRFPGVLAWNEVQEGQELADLAGEDGSSIRYGVINLGAADRAGLRRRLDEVLRALDWRFEPLRR